MFIYVIATIFYCIFEFFIWIFKWCEWCTDYDRCKLRYLFKVYDLGMIIFPWSIPVVLLISAICIIVDMFESPEKYANITLWINKPLFKDKELKEDK